MAKPMTMAVRISACGGGLAAPSERRYRPFRHDRGHYAAKAAGHEDQEVHRIAEQHEPEQHADQRPRQQQVDRGGEEDAGERGDDVIHQRPPRRPRSASATAVSVPKHDEVDPDVEHHRGRERDLHLIKLEYRPQPGEERHVESQRQCSLTVPPAPRRTRQQVIGCARKARRASLDAHAPCRRWPAPTAAMSPPMKPPPGSLCPRSSTNTENTSITAVSSGAMVRKISEFMPPPSASASSVPEVAPAQRLRTPRSPFAPGPADQRQDGDAGGHHHGDLAQRIEPAEVDEDDS